MEDEFGKVKRVAKRFGFTPLRGSYWRSTRVGNAGTYAA